MRYMENKQQQASLQCLLCLFANVPIIHLGQWFNNLCRSSLHRVQDGSQVADWTLIISYSSTEHRAILAWFVSCKWYFMVNLKPFTELFTFGRFSCKLFTEFDSPLVEFVHFQSLQGRGLWLVLLTQDNVKSWLLYSLQLQPYLTR